MNSAPDRNTSPVGWYLASYLIRFVELDREDRDDPEARFLSWENTVLIQAGDLDEAYDKTVNLAREGSFAYKAGSRGVDAKWEFVGVTELLPIYEPLEDGSEIAWRERRPSQLRNLRKRCRQRDAFLQ